MNERKGKGRGTRDEPNARRVGGRQWAMLFFYVCLSVRPFPRFNSSFFLSVPNVDSILREMGRDDHGHGQSRSSYVYCIQTAAPATV